MVRQAYGENKQAVENGKSGRCAEQSVCYASRTKVMGDRIGLVIARTNEQPVIIAPSCLDYSHRDGAYDFRSVGTGVSLLGERQIRFLERLTRVLPQAEVRILMPNQEADDPVLSRAVGRSREELLACVEASVAATRAKVASRGWQVRLMTDEIPNLVETEEQLTAKLMSDGQYFSRIVGETVARLRMYERICPQASFSELMERSARTSAQYLVMGEYVARHGYLVSSHTTTNLGWYLETGPLSCIYRFLFFSLTILCEVVKTGPGL